MSLPGFSSMSQVSPVSSRRSSPAVARLRLPWINAARRRVECSLRVLHVGHRDQADLEALLGLLELAADGVVRRLRGLERVLRRQHVEVGLGRAQDQVLLGDDIIGFGLGAARSRRGW